MGGEVVRLEQGKAERKTVYSSNPVSFARQWHEAGAQYLHLVDLDAAFQGNQANLPLVAAICESIPIPCELGGGLRDLVSLRKAFAAGVARVIIGSKACESLDFVKEAVKEFGGDRIAVGIDAKDGRVAVRGWVEVSEWTAVDLAKAVVDLGVETLIYTDISTDGMLQGPNLEAQKAMLQATPAHLIASGGVSSLQDLRDLQGLSGLHGVIVGKALYDKKVSLAECLLITR